MKLNLLFQITKIQLESINFVTKSIHNQSETDAFPIKFVKSLEPH